MSCFLVILIDWRDWSVTLFYGILESETTCLKCNTIFYSFQYFQFLSFPMRKYDGKYFNLYKGFKAYEKEELLCGNNQYHCNKCNGFQDATLKNKIYYSPPYLLINIDYGKNKRFQPNEVDFGIEIDITRFVCSDFQPPLMYELIGVCCHLGSSGSCGHYIAKCKDNKNQWYLFNDSSCSPCDKREIYLGSPYLLLYRKKNNNNN